MKIFKTKVKRSKRGSSIILMDIETAPLPNRNKIHWPKKAWEFLGFYFLTISREGEGSVPDHFRWVDKTYLTIGPFWICIKKEYPGVRL